MDLYLCVSGAGTHLCVIVVAISAEHSRSFQVFLRSGLAVKWLSRKPLPQKASAGNLYNQEDFHKIQTRGFS